jgi:hypothetical protein
MPMGYMQCDLARLTVCGLLTCSLAERCSYRFLPYLTALLPTLTGSPAAIEQPLSSSISISTARPRTRRNRRRRSKPLVVAPEDATEELPAVRACQGVDQTHELSHWERGNMWGAGRAGPSDPSEEVREEA